LSARAENGEWAWALRELEEQLGELYGRWLNGDTSDIKHEKTFKLKVVPGLTAHFRTFPYKGNPKFVSNFIKYLKTKKVYL